MLKSLSLAGKNWKVLLKAIICQTLILALVIALGFLLFGGFIEEALGILSESNVKEFAYNTVTSVIDGTFESAVFASELTAVIDRLQDSISSIHNFWGSVEITYISLILMFCAYRILISLTDVAVDCQLEEYMTSMSSRPFSWFFFKKQGRSWKFAVVQFLIGFPLDLLIATGCIGFYLLFLIAFNWWTIIPVAILLILLYSVRLTLFAFCLPAVAVEDMPPYKAFKYGMSQVIGRFGKVLWKNLVIVTAIVALALISLLYVQDTIWTVVLFTVPNFFLCGVFQRDGTCLFL